MQSSSKDFSNLSARALADGLRLGQWSSVELTHYFLARIREINPRIHAVVSLEANALAQAADSDRRRASGQPLSEIDGLPMTLKDAFRLKGSLSTYGMWMFRKYRPKADATLMAAVRASGVVILGRTAVPTGAFDWNCRNQIHPECVNPYDSTRTPGGSSGGAAAALAAGLTPLEVGSDLGGSIRYPAHCCGVFGLRTTEGWLPVADLGPERSPTAFHNLVSCGPMARELGDLSLLLDLFEKSFSHPLPKSYPRAGGVLRIAYVPDLLGLPADTDTQNLFTNIRQKLVASGHHVELASPKLDWDALFSDWGLIAGFEATAIVPWVLRRHWILNLYSRLVLQRRLGKGPFLTYFRQGLNATRAAYEAAVERRKSTWRELDRFFTKFDLWMLPVSPSSAIPLERSGRDIGGVPYVSYLGSYLGPTTITGTPALVCPIGRDSHQMPIGIQIHAARFADRELVKAVQHLILSPL